MLRSRSYLRREIRHRLTPDTRLLDATSGNTGISYAMLGAILGFGVTLVLPANAGIERKKMLRAYGAELIETDPMQGMDLAIATAQAMATADPVRYFYADQYSNDANWRAHYDGTAIEILEQTGRRMTHFVAGLGTSGTFVGTTRRLRVEMPQVRCVAFIPDSPYHGLEGLKHMPTAHQPAIWDASLADDVLEVPTEVAQEMVLRLAREEGLLVGMSSGAAVVATRRLMRRHGAGVYVTVLPDSGLKYLSQPLFGSRSRSRSAGGDRHDPHRERHPGRDPRARRGDLSGGMLRRACSAGPAKSASSTRRCRSTTPAKTNAAGGSW